MIREVADIYRASKKKKDINWWTEWVCRPPAAFFVYLLQGTRVTPNQVTILSALICAGAGAMYITLPGHLWVVMATVVFELSFVFDCVDGQLARVRKVASPLGHLFDFLMDEIKAMLLFGCITIRLWIDSGDERFLVVGLAALFALASGISMTSFMRRPEYGAPPPTADGQPAVIARRTGAVGFVISALEHLARTVVHYPSYIWLCAAFNRIDIFFWIYSGVNVLYLARTSLVLLLKLGRFAPAAPAGVVVGSEDRPS